MGDFSSINNFPHFSFFKLLKITNISLKMTNEKLFLSLIKMHSYSEIGDANFEVCTMNFITSINVKKHECCSISIVLL